LVLLDHPFVRETIEHFRRSSVLMDHFVEQVSHLPMRMLTGVRAPRPDSGADPPP